MGNPGVGRSFWASSPPADRADAEFSAYLDFLRRRNGPALDGGGFETRERMMSELAAGIEPSRKIDNERFNRNYAGFVDTDLTQDELALLAFVKINAGEAYGVEVTSKARAHLLKRERPIYRVEEVITEEETYHTRILVGATAHFEGLEVSGAWRPAWPLKLLIFCLAQFPPSLFHPVLLGAEVAGVFSFNWLLNRVHTLFPDDPAIRESMEERLVQILVDEVGHIAFNRIALGSKGFGAAKTVAAGVLKSQERMTPELKHLGLDAEARTALDTFDLDALPEEVRRAAFFV